MSGKLETLLGTEQLAALLGVPVATLYAWRNKGEGPKAIKVGRHVKYRPTDVEAWLERHTSDAA